MLTDQMFVDGYDLMREYQKLVWSQFPARDEAIAALSDDDLAALLETPGFTGRANATLGATRR